MSEGCYILIIVVTDTCGDYSYRYNNLNEPAVCRSSLLQRSLSLHQFLRDVQDQLKWLVEKQRIAESDEVGQDLLGMYTLVFHWCLTL